MIGNCDSVERKAKRDWKNGQKKEKCVGKTDNIGKMLLYKRTEHGILCLRGECHVQDD